jgi:hypothetical protein
MKKATHTPGPWNTPKDTWCDYGNEKDGHDYNVPVDLSDKTRVIVWGENLERCQANAQLIAATPELLKELKESSRQLRKVQEYFLLPQSERNKTNFITGFLRSSIGGSAQISANEKIIKKATG